MKRVIIKCLAFFLLLGVSIPGFSQNLKVAVAANLQSVIKVLQVDFTKKTGIVIEPIVGSSGNLVAQISNGAPYDVFLSADMSFPETLYKTGFGLDKPIVYAAGSLIICSSQNIDLKNWKKLITGDGIQKIALANPKIAPYGKAAEQTLQKEGLLDKIQSKVVYGESIAQVNTYITTGVVGFGFTTQALVKDPATQGKLYWQLIPSETYDPIEQGMVILKHAKESNYLVAQKFYRYILSSAAKAIFKNYGYNTN